MRILLLDNYDSFTYNLVEVIRQEVPEVLVEVHRNDKIRLETVASFDKILLSPGPSVPEHAGIMLDLIKKYAPNKPILGICLGHQAIGEAFGGKLLNIDPVKHGIQSNAKLDQHYLFEGVDREISIGRYHSWVIDEKFLPSVLHVTARSADGQIMAVSHQDYDVCGLQFHPESVMTPAGGMILRNWIAQAPGPKGGSGVGK